MSILDAVEPDCWRKNESVQWDSRIHTTITHKSEFPEKVARLFNSPLYSRETVESLLAENRKQVLIEAELYLINLSSRYIPAALELRRMAESDKTTMEGEK